MEKNVNFSASMWERSKPSGTNPEIHQQKPDRVGPSNSCNTNNIAYHKSISVSGHMLRTLSWP